MEYESYQESNAKVTNEEMIISSITSNANKENSGKDETNAIIVQSEQDILQTAVVSTYLKFSFD